MTTTNESSKPADGGPAFPCMHEGSTRSDTPGMTLRDYFAAKAMQGLLYANSVYSTSSYSDELSERAYQIADSMLKARG
ncbi:hypothetical protein [Burkholderia gladioli]|uniref:hypothetical protein n=1 Tax=Burkholderia gladioli TaxID=28095 RepID=UPI001ABAB7BC|nr:hypothetical protein [Burkholderia gladioli]